MYGAILGDIIGSPYEGRREVKAKSFELFSTRSRYTDDTVMTIAIAQALMSVDREAEEHDIKKSVIETMRIWGRNYPYAGYGRGFRKWIFSEEPHPYYSFGNGSAMRVSATGWMYSTVEQTRRIACYTAEVTHNHPEGIKGAEAVASCIFLARAGASKEEIRKYVEENFSYDLSRTLEQIRPKYRFDVTCQGSVPESIISFMEADDYEDAVRNAVFLGGDTDTMAAIAGGIAEAYYGLNAELRKECRKRVEQDMLVVLDKFDEMTK